MKEFNVKDARAISIQFRETDRFKELIEQINGMILSEAKNEYYYRVVANSYKLTSFEAKILELYYIEKGFKVHSSSEGLNFFIHWL
jgi:hypothetical protein